MLQKETAGVFSMCVNTTKCGNGCASCNITTLKCRCTLCCIAAQ
jgi:hypothetical protein